MLHFSDRQKLVIQYRIWLSEACKETNCKFEDCPETFLSYLISHELVNEEKAKQIIYGRW